MLGNVWEQLINRAPLDDWKTLCNSKYIQLVKLMGNALLLVAPSKDHLSWVFWIQWAQARDESTEAVVWRCFVKKEFLEISQNWQENNCARVSFLIKLHACQQLYYKMRLWRRCFPVNFAKFLRTLFLQNTSGGCFWK